MQAQIQALLAAAGGATGGAEREVAEVNRGYQMGVAKLAIFSREAGKVGGVITAYRLYLRMKMKEATVEEQVQWVLSYVQGGLADVWKENVMEELEAGEIEHEMVEEFLISLKKEFRGGEEKSVKAAELRKGGKTMEEFVQEFKRAVKGSRYKGRPLVEEFKRRMNGGIRRKLMEVESLPASIEQWYRRAMALDRNWRESRREEKRLREKKETGGEAPKQEQQQILPRPLVSRSLTVDFILFFLFIFILLFCSFSFNFLFLEQLRLEVISHAVTSVTNQWCGHKTDHGT